MAKVCAFCGKELGIFDRNTLLAGNVSQPACQDCWNRLLDLPQGERARLALETGRAVEPEALHSFLEAEEAQRKEQREAERRRRATGLTCRYCGGPMLNFQRKHFNMGEEGLLGGIVARDGWLASFLELDMLSCQDCGRVEFYRPGYLTLPEVAEDPEEQDQVTCPVCGTRHSTLVNCPKCAVHSAMGRQQPQGEDAPREPKRRDRKPPWEK